jgi:serine/threonine protein kinase/tetratricopeptide (TPR) repeat protein
MADRSSDDSTPDVTRAQSSRVPGTQTIGAYRLLERVGDGGMGDVWLAEQTQPIHRRVALKVIKAGMDTAQVVARFEAERQALALMDHPAIAKVFDAGATPEGRPYFAMEYARGEAITEYAIRHRLTVPDRLDLFLQVCDGVQHAHQKGIIHRDLKPSNVLVVVRDDRPFVKVIDFGVAKATTQNLTERTLHTESGAFIGTPEYMSPEQAEFGGLDIDTRTDVYALGVLLYELLTDTLPFESKALREKGLDEIRRTIREVDPPRPSTRVTVGVETTDGVSSPRTDIARLARHLRGDLDWITMKALEKDRTRRYGSVSDLAADLRRHLDEVPVLAGQPSTVYRLSKFVRRHRVGVTVATTLVVLLAMFATTMTVQARRIAQERDRANREAEASRQVAAFLTGLFNVSDPSEARGNTLSAREILDKGAREIEQNLRSQPEVQAQLQSTIGTVYTNLGRYSAAEPLLRRAMDTMKQMAGEDDLATLSVMSALADVYWYQERYREAEPLYEQVVKGRTRRLGAEHRDTLRAQFDLASTYGREDRPAEAERLIFTVLDGQRLLLGEEHHDTVQTIGILSNLYWRQGRYAEALPLATRALEILRKVSGPDHPATLEAMHNVATTYDRLEKNAEAESVYVDTISAKRRVQGDGHPSTLLTELRFAQMLQKLDRFSDSEAQLLRAQGALDTAGAGANPQRKQQISEQLVVLYQAWGKPTKAAEWRAKKQKEPPKP